MSVKFRDNLMKLIALTAVFSFIYPGIYILESVISRGSSGASGILLAVFAVISGYLAGKKLMKEKFRIIAHLLCIIPLIIGVLVHIGDGILMQLLEAFSASVFYLIGLRANLKEFESIIAERGFYTGLIFSTGFVLVSTYISSLHHLILLISFLVFIAVASSIIVINQANLDSMVMKKEAHSASITKNIRIYNVKVVFIFLIIIALLLNLNGMVASFIDIVKSVMVAVIRFIFKIASYLFPEVEAQPNRIIPDNQPPLVVEEGKQNPVMNIIFYILGGVILVYILYKLVPVIISKVKELIIRFSRFIMHIIFKSSNKANRESNTEYTDEVEIIRPEKVKKNETAKSRAKSSRKSLRAITDPGEKVRFLYACVVEMLLERKFDVRKSDTTGEILNKSLKINGVGSYLGKLTEVYNAVRYGKIVPDGRMVSDTEDNFSKISEIIRKNK